MRQDAGVQSVFIDCFDCKLRAGGVVTCGGDIQRGNDNGIHLSKEQTMLVVLLIQSNVMNTCTIGDQMWRFLFGICKERC